MMAIVTFVAGMVVGALIPSMLPRRKSKRIRVDENGHWHFPVDTMGQMLAIPESRRERFLAEFPDTLRGIWKMQSEYPIATLPGTVWVDDGLGELRPHIVNAPENIGDAFGKRPLHEGAQS